MNVHYRYPPRQLWKCKKDRNYNFFFNFYLAECGNISVVSLADCLALGLSALARLVVVEVAFGVEETIQHRLFQDLILILGRFFVVKEKSDLKYDLK